MSTEAGEIAKAVTQSLDNFSKSIKPTQFCMLIKKKMSSSLVLFSQVVMSILSSVKKHPKLKMEPKCLSQGGKSLFKDKAGVGGIWWKHLTGKMTRLKFTWMAFICAVIPTSVLLSLSNSSALLSLLSLSGKKRRMKHFSSVLIVPTLTSNKEINLKNTKP